MNARKGPVIIDLDEAAARSPVEAPPVPDPVPAAQTGGTMEHVARLATRPPSRLARLFWGALVGLVGFVTSLAAWDYATTLLARSPLLGGVAVGLIGLVLLGLVLFGLRELAGFSRLRRIDGLRDRAGSALADGDLTQARDVTERLTRLYSGRDDLSWGRARLEDRKDEPLEAASLLALAEAELLAPIDKAATREVEAAARQVATVTAVVPLALADVVTALVANMRMIRRVAELYGGRAGTLGNWRLTRAVFAHLVATGAVAVGDDLIGSVAGGGLVSKLSRRFGEGIVNGALTARVGVAAIEVCRPLPFVQSKRPSVTGLTRRALMGLFT
ncbi:MAG: YcjF family protein [Brevirhabdus sp.]